MCVRPPSLGEAVSFRGEQIWFPKSLFINWENTPPPISGSAALKFFQKWGGPLFMISILTEIQLLLRSTSCNHPWKCPWNSVHLLESKSPKWKSTDTKWQVNSQWSCSWSQITCYQPKTTAPNHLTIPRGLISLDGRGKSHCGLVL